MIRFLLAACLGFALWSCAHPVSAQDPDALAAVERRAAGPLTETVVIETQNGPVTFQAELANTPDATATGLMGRESLAENTGMLFDFGETRPTSMWMKDTLIPLDMLFMDEAGTIVFIGVNAQPLSLQQIGPDRPVRGVFEMAGGESLRLGIAPGDVVRHPLFGNVDALVVTGDGE